MDIPGMYFDKEKNKYFKIEPGTAHSKDMIKRRRLNDTKADEARTLKLTRKPYIKRSATLQDSLLGGLVRRELGGRCAPEEAIAARFDGAELIFEDQVGTRSELPMPAFDWDPITRGLFIPRNGHRMLTGCPESSADAGRTYFLDSATLRTNRHRPIYQYLNCRSLVYEPKKILSISVNQSARLVATTRTDTFGPFGIVLVFLQNSVAVPNDPDRMVADGSHIHISPPRTSGVRPNMTVWTSTPAPPSSDLSFVIGMDNNIMAIGKERANTKWISHASSRTVEILALEFLHNSKDILLTGDRKGQISLLDLRDPNPMFGLDTIQNCSSVTHIKSLDDHRILVAGPGEENGSTMFQYDLRWRRPPPLTKKKTHKYTKPILEYPDHHNTYPTFGLDVDVDAGLVAAAQEDQTIQIFSLHGGHKADFIGEREKRDHRVECLRFLPDRDGSTKSLYVAGIDQISRYAW